MIIPGYRPINRDAIASVVLGLWLGGIGSLCAALSDHMALNSIQHTRDATHGEALAVLGLILDYPGMLAGLLYGFPTPRIRQLAPVRWRDAVCMVNAVTTSHERPVVHGSSDGDPIYVTISQSQLFTTSGCVGWTKQ